MPEQLVFLPGRTAENRGPLARYLPPMSEGVVAAWLRENIPAGGCVLDPFGASPQLAVEAARGGYRVVVAANNPIARFLLELAAAPPLTNEMRAALAELAAARRGEERMEPHILSLYTTRCDHCHSEVVAEAFLWERDAEGPYGRIYACPHCQNAGEFPATPADSEQAARYASSALHRARALERVAPTGDPNRAHAEEALDAYLPRAVYALFTLINKLDGLSLSPQRRNLLAALLLSACDRANSLWAHPSGRARPRQLRTSSRFREHNVWFALEQAIDTWAHSGETVPLVDWPELPPQNGISVFEGRLKDLVGALSGVEIDTVVTAFPRPNQAFWTLSALWAGWLWGREAVGPFVGVLRRRRYDWAWHTKAVHAALESLAPKLSANTPMFGLITESEPGFDAAVMAAGEMAGFELLGLANRPKSGQSQLLWQRREDEPKVVVDDPEQIAAQSALDYLGQRGEPANYLRVQAAGLSGLSHAGYLRSSELPPGEFFSLTRSLLEHSFTFQRGFLRYEASERSPEVGKWWLRRPEPSRNPSTDRLEMALVQHLIAHPAISMLDMDAAMCTAFPGLLTPEREDVIAVLESYAQGDAVEGWHIRPVDTPQARRDDLREMHRLLRLLGERLGCEVAGEKPLLWQEADGRLVYVFYQIASAIFSEIVLNSQHPPERGVIVLPGGRANLVMHKLRRDPRLSLAVEAGWRFVKFRQVRGLAENLAINRESFDELLEADPLTYDQPQMQLL